MAKEEAEDANKKHNPDDVAHNTSSADNSDDFEYTNSINDSDREITSLDDDPPNHANVDGKGSIVPKLNRVALSQYVLQHTCKDVNAESHKRIKLSNDGSKLDNAQLIDVFHKQLDSLRQLIPSHKQGELDKPDSIVSATLQHLEDLKKQIRVLKENILAHSTISKPNVPNKQETITSAHVEVEILNNGNNIKDKIKIFINCAKRKGLMAELVSSMESLGLIFDAMNVSFNDGMFSFQAMAIPKVHPNIGTSIICEEVVKDEILNVIFCK